MASRDHEFEAQPPLEPAGTVITRRTAIAMLVALGVLPSAAFGDDDGGEGAGEGADNFEASLQEFITQFNAFFKQMAEINPPPSRTFSLKLRVPSPVTSNGVSVFDQAHQAYQRIFSSDAPENSALELRNLNDVVAPTAKDETKAYSVCGTDGQWAMSSVRGPFGKDTSKCNIAAQEWAMKSGLYPLYNQDGEFANTKQIYNNPDSFVCWRPTNDPAPGRYYVYYSQGGVEHHMGVVSQVQASYPGLGEVGKGISALTHVTQELPAFWNDDGIYKAVLMHRGHPASKSDIPVKFFEYHCPDQGVMDRFFYDEGSTP